jgi:hypothetical protein
MIQNARSACADLCRNVQLIAQKPDFSRVCNIAKDCPLLHWWVGEWFRLLISQKCRA